MFHRASSNSNGCGPVLEDGGDLRARVKWTVSQGSHMVEFGREGRNQGVQPVWPEAQVRAHSNLHTGGYYSRKQRTEKHSMLLS